MYYNTFQQIIIKNKLKTILRLIKQIKIDSLCYHDLQLLNKFIIKSLFIFRLVPLKKSIMFNILESLYKTIETLIGKKVNISYEDFIIKLDRMIFILKMLSVKLYDTHKKDVVEIRKNKITVNDRYEHY
ncbi:hypothetical protein [Dolichospermum phage Dfl-JY23]